MSPVLRNAVLTIVVGVAATVGVAAATAMPARDATELIGIAIGTAAVAVVLGLPLLHLLRRRAFTREELLERVWGYSFGDTATVTVHVRRLREKIEVTPSEPQHLVTVWGVGYRWDP